MDQKASRPTTSVTFNGKSSYPSMSESSGLDSRKGVCGKAKKKLLGGAVLQVFWDDFCFLSDLILVDFLIADSSMREPDSIIKDDRLI